MYEDFTDPSWIEVDPNNHISVANSTHVDFEACREHDAYLYKNYSTDYFSTFKLSIDAKFIDGVSNTQGHFLLLSNALESVDDLLSTTETYITLYFKKSIVYTRIGLQEGYNGLDYNDVKDGISFNTMYYFMVVKEGTLLTVEIYSTSNLRNIGGAGDVGSLSLTLHANHNFQYLMVCNTWSSSNQEYLGNIDVENLLFSFYTIIFRFNNGGILRVNNITFTNGTSKGYNNGTILELVSIPQNSSFVFSYFEWDSNNATTNPYNLTITSNMTVWLYFSVPSVDGVYMGYGLVLLGLIIGLVIGVLLGSKK